MTECQIWLDDTKFAVVDPEDFEWAKRWKWHATANSTGKKFYATRVTWARGDDGVRRRVKVYLHKEILKRAGKRKPSKHHSIGDHDDGDSLNDRRSNLFWATFKINNSRHRQRHLLAQKGFFDEAEL